MMHRENVDLGLIQKQELFSHLAQSQIEFVMSHTGILKLPKNARLFSPGERASCFYMLISGDIRVFKKRDDGSDEEMAHFTSGDTIGDFDFARGASYDACADAAKDCHLITFPGQGFTMDSLSAKEPGTVCIILLNAIVMMTGRIKATNRLLLDNLSWVQDLHRRAYEDAGTGLWKQTLITDEIKDALSDPAALIMVKPDRFKILVDSRGHHAGDEAMIKIALILKNMTRMIGHSWALRLKSNEVALIINDCNADQAAEIAKHIASEIKDIEPSPAITVDKADGSSEDFPPFYFSAVISWCIWPIDGSDWDSLFQSNYTTLLDTWKAQGDSIVHYKNNESKG
ncbi:MAG: diguanylate cyclase [Treponema sp.]|nr:diguanylate cyclase [Treponema sp.]